MSQIPEFMGGRALEHNAPFETGKGISNKDGTATIVAGASGWTVVGTWAAGGAIGLANGTAAAPSLNFTNSSTTGLYRSAANVIGIALAGVAGIAIAGSAPTFAAATDTVG